MRLVTRTSARSIVCLYLYVVAIFECNVQVLFLLLLCICSIEGIFISTLKTYLNLYYICSFVQQVVDANFWHDTGEPP